VSVAKGNEFVTTVRLIGGPMDGQLREIPPGPLQVEVTAPYSAESPNPIQRGRYVPDAPTPTRRDPRPSPRTEPNGTVWLKWDGWVSPAPGPRPGRLR